MPKLNPPSDLRPRGRGRAFWRSVAGRFGLRPDELEILAESARVLDLIDDLRQVIADEGVMTTNARDERVVHPAVIELRQLREQFRKNVAALALPDEGDPSGAHHRAPNGQFAPAGPNTTPVVSRQRRAAVEQRWRKHARL